MKECLRMNKNLMLRKIKIELFDLSSRINLPNCENDGVVLFQLLNALESF